MSLYRHCMLLGVLVMRNTGIDLEVSPFQGVLTVGAFVGVGLRGGAGMRVL